jgi:hypothetical protein
MRMSNGRLGDKLCRPAVAEAYVADPLACPRAPSGWPTRGSQQGGCSRAAAWTSRADLRVPRYGGPDRTRRGVEAIGNLGNVAPRHDESPRTHHEPEHEHVLAEVVEWLEAQRALLEGQPARLPEAVATRV